MRTHDYHLRGYEVLDSGSTIVLDLVYDYPGRPKHESRVRFNGVELYHFIHPTGAILFGIEAVPLDDIVDEHRVFIEAAAAMEGVRGWRDTMENYRSYIEKAGAAVWEITSSIGFDGFVIARSVEQVGALHSLGSHLG
jgi:hypothetical protein